MTAFRVWRPLVLTGTFEEMNGPGGLFGLVHAHLMCAILNTSYYEYFPNGSRDIIGKEIGLLHPSLPGEGHVVPPRNPARGTRGAGEHRRARPRRK